MMALVDEACNHRPNVRAQQMGSQCGRRERLWPSSLDASLDVTSVANAYRASRLTGGVFSSSPLPLGS